MSHWGSSNENTQHTFLWRIEKNTWLPLLSVNESLYERASILKRKEFTPIGSKFFPFRVDPFSEGRHNNFSDSCFP